MSAPESTEVVVIGGGPAGLTAAIELAQRGVEVTVFERRRHLAPSSRASAQPTGGHRKIAAAFGMTPEILVEDDWKEIDTPASPRTSG